MDWLGSQKNHHTIQNRDGMSLDFQFLNDFPLPLCVQHVNHRQCVERARMTACSRVCCLSNSLLHTRLLDATNKHVYVALTHYDERENCGSHGSAFWDSISCSLMFADVSEEPVVSIIRDECVRGTRCILSLSKINAINFNP